MAQTGYTPISIYYSATASNTPTAGNLVAGELAINTADGKLFYKDSAGVVQVIAGKGGAGVAGGSNTQVQYNSSGSLAGSSSFTWDNTNGRLGVGTSSPTTLLTVSGAGSTGLLTINRTDGSGFLTLNATNNVNGVQLSSTGVGFFQIYTNVQSSSVLATTFDNVGNVGIGTSGPTAYTNQRTLAISSTWGGSIDIQLGTTVAARWYTDSSQNSYFGTSTANSQIFVTNTTERMRIDSAGNVGIGVTPSAWSQGKALEVGGLGGGIWGNGVADIYTTSNVYYNSGWKYASTNGAGVGVYEINGSSHYWYGAPSGTTGGAVTLTGILSVRQGYTLALQGASGGISGTGISFPATQSASSDANTLDDYEKGTWTPVITSQGGSITSYTATGTYTKVGRVVTVQCSIILNTVGTATGYAIVNGYPFANSSNGSAQGVCRENNAGLIVYSVITNSNSTGYVIGSVAGAITWINGYSYFFNMTYQTA